MQVPESLSRAFGEPFEKLLGDFLTQRALITGPEDLSNRRFLNRSILPHVEKLSSLFNREEVEQDTGLQKYWKESSNPEHLRLAYFIYFMPCNLFRTAAVINELSQLGFQWSASPRLRGIEFGAGPASGACGIAAGLSHSQIGAPKTGDWALIEQDRATLDLGAAWATHYFNACGLSDWGVRSFHRRVELDRDLLPRSAPQFNLWVMSYFLNESTASEASVARTLSQSWKKHLEDEGIVILIEPALKLQSRRLLKLRQELLRIREEQGDDWQILLPCLGHQACGALEAPEDWCHEEATWWRPKYLKQIDELASLDRKTLHFSYLVIIKSKRPRQEILPALRGAKLDQLERLVSPAHEVGRDLAFFGCGQGGKRRLRARTELELNRGDLIEGTLDGNRVTITRKLTQAPSDSL